MNFTPAKLFNEIKQYVPAFEITYAPDQWQAIADNWLDSIDNSSARNDWGWESRFCIKSMTEEMLRNI